MMDINLPIFTTIFTLCLAYPYIYLLKITCAPNLSSTTEKLMSYLHSPFIPITIYPVIQPVFIFTILPQSHHGLLTVHLYSTFFPIHNLSYLPPHITLAFIKSFATCFFFSEDNEN